MLRKLDNSTLSVIPPPSALPPPPQNLSRWPRRPGPTSSYQTINRQLHRTASDNNGKFQYWTWTKLLFYVLHVILAYQLLTRPSNAFDARHICRTCNTIRFHSRIFDVSKIPQNTSAARTILKTQYWNNGVVPYRLDKTYPPSDIKLIKASMKVIEGVSCVKFIPREKGDKDYLMFRNTETCSSHIGKMGGRQGLHIGPKCMKKSDILHEVMHALGFIHEHSRPDRDKYIKINIDNVLKEYKHNFDKYEEAQVDTLKEEYDIVSITHYDSHAYAINEKTPTIVALDPDVHAIGSKGKLSAADIRKLNKLYKCER